MKTTLTITRGRLLCIVSLFLLILVAMSSNVPACEADPNADYSKRKLSIVAFDSRSPGHSQRKMRGYGRRFGAGVKEIVVLGKNSSWKPLGLFNKPLHYSRWVNETMAKLIEAGEDVNNSYAMMLDTDTLVNARPMNDVWRRFDCARKGKPILMGGEVSCWSGLRCKKSHIKIYYEPLGPTMHSFINSGYVMGTLPGLQKLFSYIVNKRDYIGRVLHWVPFFCDQGAFMVFYGNNRHMAQIDHYQQVFATLSIFAAVGAPRSMYVCRHQDTRSVVTNCSEALYRKEYFSVDPESCVMNISDTNVGKRDALMRQYLNNMSPNPVIFHGNAKGKHVAQILKPLLSSCLIKKYTDDVFNGEFILD